MRMGARWVGGELFLRIGKILRTCTVKVLNIRVNPSLAPEQFDLRFPEGTRVHDKRTGKDYCIGSDGRMRELSATGEELESSIAQPDDSWLQRHWGLVMAVGIVVAILVVSLIMRARNKAKPGLPPTSVKI
jgi:hypothetical protein